MEDLDQHEALALAMQSSFGLATSENKITIPALCSQSLSLDLETLKINDTFEKTSSPTCSARGLVTAFEKEANKIHIRLEVQEEYTAGDSPASSKPRIKIKSGSIKRVLDWTFEKGEKSSADLSTWQNNGQIVSSGTVTMQSEKTLTINTSLTANDDPLDADSKFSPEMKQKMKEVADKLTGQGQSQEEINKLFIPLINDPIFNTLGTKVKLSGYIESDGKKISHAKLLRIVVIVLASLMDIYDDPS